MSAARVRGGDGSLDQMHLASSSVSARGALPLLVTERRDEASASPTDLGTALAATSRGKARRAARLSKALTQRRH